MSVCQFHFWGIFLLAGEVKFDIPKSHPWALEEIPTIFLFPLVQKTKQPPPFCVACEICPYPRPPGAPKDVFFTSNFSVVWLLCACKYFFSNTYLSCALLKFLDLWVDILHQFWKALRHSFFKYCFYPLSLSSALRIPITGALDFLLSYLSQILSVFSSLYLGLHCYHSGWILPIFRFDDCWFFPPPLCCVQPTVKCINWILCL